MSTFITSQQVDFLMNEEGNSILNLSLHVKTIMFLMIGIIIVTGISVGSLMFNQNQPAIAQQPRQQQEQALTSKDISFQMGNMTFSHNTASVNGIQLHYVIGGQGDPIVLLHGWPETWYAWHKLYIVSVDRTLSYHNYND
jgi:hypothetical protein